MLHLGALVNFLCSSQPIWIVFNCGGDGSRQFWRNILRAEVMTSPHYTLCPTGLWVLESFLYAGLFVQFLICYFNKHCDDFILCGPDALFYHCRRLWVTKDRCAGSSISNGRFFHTSIFRLLFTESNILWYGDIFTGVCTWGILGGAGTHGYYDLNHLHSAYGCGLITSSIWTFFLYYFLKFCLLIYNHKNLAWHVVN